MPTFYQVPSSTEPDRAEVLPIPGRPERPPSRLNAALKFLSDPVTDARNRQPKGRIPL